MRLCQHLLPQRYVSSVITFSKAASSMWWFGGSVVASAFEPVGVQSDRDAPLARLVTHSSAHPKASSIISSTFYFSVQNAANEPCHGTTAYDAPGICMGDA
ncbi:hypothetical protein, variant 2 [Blastomyces gilchristii SLH14081]|uniref:Uncharacterized protein n=2 Tax=Blastomyces TaxID=229219 RepID=A0A179UZZ3_BLAGS|nr:uncharacterized protein BDBG_07336 [Blastomyces gilchristii SLH14081]XP_031580123.1 hypothetical protein, variant 1 [Blastomyces gilchristii SLH14081]XP_031580124.1 hypothetical protein, variant 2 [Blastomyces gilchristii SLH14081]EQL29055.1 hypothetical protein BDFG_08259 [Blastomyces dermatitidis ATCC 26199]KMW67787.1 hypothetical protein BDDG_12331 [Blastomyces dermatitidis ATCC 18188]EQL29056.1 hypothetical protein, variant 1 [Blastomyces dermatitidis ATCC 26199]EQL29057.1 hypothetical